MIRKNKRHVAIFARMTLSAKIELILEEYQVLRNLFFLIIIIIIFNDFETTIHSGFFCIELHIYLICSCVKENLLKFKL